MVDFRYRYFNFSDDVHKLIFPIPRTDYYPLELRSFAVVSDDHDAAGTIRRGIADRGDVCRGRRARSVPDGGRFRRSRRPASQ